MYRLTVVGSVYYLSDEESSEVTARFTREIKSSEQVYPRRLQVGNEWEPLDIGWLDSCGMLCIENRAPKIPNQLQKLKRDDPHLVELSYTQDSQQSFLIPPQETYFLLPSNATGLFIRSNESATVMLHAVPE